MTNMTILTKYLDVGNYFKILMHRETTCYT